MIRFDKWQRWLPFLFNRQGLKLTTNMSNTVKSNSSETNSNATLMAAYARVPLAFERGEGAYLFDDNNERYLDLLSGIAVCGLGHCHPAVTKALSKQAATLIHTSNMYRITKQTLLAEKLVALSGMENGFFCNSGAEANEAAIKLARLFGHKKNIDAPAIIVMDGSFHGRTLATLSATSNRKVQAGFEPLVSGFIRAPFDDLEALKNIANNNQNVAAILVEPIQGEGGIRIPKPDYLNNLRQLCDQYDWLLMLDEIQTGNGRTGQFFNYQHNNILPDVVTTAKGLGNGVPIGVCLASGKAANLFQPGNHGSTYGGNPLACAAGLAVLETLSNEGLIARAAELGERMHSGLQKKLKDHPMVADIRGQGLMMGIELNEPCQALVLMALKQGLLINVTAERVIRLLPPLILSNEQADEAIEKISQLICDFADNKL